MMNQAVSPGKSCLYEGIVSHTRYLEHQRSFQYRLFQVYLDLEEIDLVFRGRWFWSTHRTAVARFRREDHLGDPAVSLSESVRDLVQQRTGQDLPGPIRLLTHLRYFGFVMNPVSFYFCFDSTDSDIVCVVAEVHNTPWGECHCYVLEWPADGPSTAKFTSEKVFHVSPFLPMGMTYKWQVSHPQDKLSIQILNENSGQKAFVANLSLRRLTMNTWNLNTRLLMYPLMTMKVVTAIYWQALKLWWMGITYYPHPESNVVQPKN